MSEKLLSHKGYLGSFTMSLDDDCLFGEVLFVNDLISYEGRTPNELQKSFVEAVDHYLARCAEEGLSPDKPFSGTFNVRLAPELHRAACIDAVKRNVSLNEFIKEAVVQALVEEKSVINETHHHNHIQKVEIVAEQNVYEETVTQWQRAIESSVPKHH